VNTQPDTRLPIIVLYFPGGFIIGDQMALAPLARTLVKRFNVVVVAPKYRLAPEHPFPIAVEDGWDTLSWIAKNGESIQGDPAKGFIVGGISSGGNITNVITHLAIENDLQPPISGVWLSCAGVRIAPKDAHLLPEKYQERNLSRTQDECVNSVTTSAGMEKFKKDALKADFDSRLFAPMIWSTDAGFGHTGFPKTYSQVAGIDTARDESLIFDDMLKSQGTPTRLDLYPGVPHFFFYTFKDLPQSKQWEEDTMAGFEWLLSPEQT
jgi:acetyl esterase/lipase